MNPAFTISKVEIEDSIEKDGRFTLKVTDDSGADVTIEQLTDAGYTITWKRGNEEVKREMVHGEEYNMAEDMSWLNVAYDKGAQATYTVTVSKGETDSKSASKKVDWYDELQNGSFEEPALNYNTSPSSGKWFYNGIVQTSQDNVLHWRTTASDRSIELGNVRKSDKFRYKNPNYYWWNALWTPEYIYRDELVTENLYRCNSAVDGDQIAELNCDGTGALYQDVMTVPGTKMNWNLSHRGRNGTDKMALVIAPLTGEHGAERITTQEQLLRYIDENRNNSNVLIEYMEDEQEWKTYTGTFNVPANQFLTRFFFVAISTSTGDLREGNLLDYVWFSTEAVPPAAGKGQLQIVKNIVGLDEEEVEKLIEKDLITYQIGEGDPQKVTLRISERNDDNSCTATFTTAIEIPTNGEVTVRVVESEEQAEIANYNLVITEAATQTVTIKEKESKVVSFTNTYTSTEPLSPDTGTLIVKKTVSGSGADYNKKFTFTVELKRAPQPDAKVVAPMSDRPNNEGPSIDNQNDSESIEINGVKFVSKDDAIVGEFTLKDGQEQRFEEIPAGVTYTIAESDNDGYTVTVNGQAKTRVTGVIEEKETIVTFNNHKDGGYTPGPTYYPLTIQKVVTGLESVPAGYKATVNIMSKYSSVPTRTLMLEPNKPQTVHLPYGEYTLTETAPAVDGYKLTGQTFSETTFMLTYGGKNVTITNAYTKEQEEPVVIPDDPMVPEDDKPDKPSKAKDDTSKVPKTGDDTPLSLALYGLIAAGALLGIRKASKRKIK